MENSEPQIQQAINSDSQRVSAVNGGDTSCPGSDEHHKDPLQCKPCSFFWKEKGCSQGNKCVFCHLCPRGATLAKRKASRQLGKQQKEQPSHSSDGSSAPSEDDKVVGGAPLKAITAAAPAPKQKSAESLEREARIQANFAKYEGMTDEELIAALPKDEAGNVTSIGAVLHASNLCGACTFLHFSKDKTCKLGMRCNFCHLPHPARDRRSNRRGPRQRNRQAEKQAHPDVEDGAPAKKRLRVDASRSSELHWDEILGAPLDWMGNSRPSWLEDQDLLDYRHPSAGTGGHPPALAAGYPPGRAASHPHAPAASYPPAAAGYPPAGGHAYPVAQLPGWPQR